MRNQRDTLLEIARWQASRGRHDFSSFSEVTRLCAEATRADAVSLRVLDESGSRVAGEFSLHRQPALAPERPGAHHSLPADAFARAETLLFVGPGDYAKGLDPAPAEGNMYAAIRSGGELIGWLVFERAGGGAGWEPAERDFAVTAAAIISGPLSRESEALYQRIASNVPGMVYQFVRHADGRIDFPFVSEGSKGIFQVDPEFIRNHPEHLINLIHPADRAAFDHSVAESARTLLPWEWEGRILFPSGEERWLRGASRPERLPDGAILWDGLLMDVTDNRRAEDELRRAHAQNEQLLAAIPSILIGVDGDGHVTQLNEVAVETFGLQMSETIGKPLDRCGIRWDSTELLDRISSCLKMPESNRREEVSYIGADGRERVLSFNITPLEVDTSHSFGFLMFGVDITERRALEAQLRHAQKLESIGQLAAGIAHEINTPTQYTGDNLRFLREAFTGLLNLVNAYRARADQAAGAELARLAEEYDLDYLVEEVPRALNQSLEGVERVARIVQSIRDFAHPDNLAKQPADLNKAIESTITMARNEWKYVADVVTDFAPDLPKVPCLLGEFNQVILNLVINAAHAIEAEVKKGAGKGTIHVSTRGADGWVEIRVRDTGCGIPARHRERVFDPFFTTKEVGQGTGQGLAIAYAIIVEKHRGEISFETEEGVGTTFLIRLPTYEETPEYLSR